MITLREVLIGFHPNISMEKILVNDEEVSYDVWLEMMYGINLDTPLVVKGEESETED